MKLNKNGFTLIEMLAVVIILGVLATIMIPSIMGIVKNNAKNNLDSLENSIKSAARMYISDNRYNIELSLPVCGTTRNLSKISGVDSMFLPIDPYNPDAPRKLKLQSLVDGGYLSSNSRGKIYNPVTKQEINLGSSGIEVLYNCSTKDYDFKEVNFDY